jgi:hypothetical protein
MRGGYNQRSGNIPEAKGMLLQTGRNSNCFKSNETQGKKKTKNQRGKGANNSNIDGSSKSGVNHVYVQKHN